MQDAIKIGLYDVSPAIRTGLKHILCSDPECTVVAEIGTLKELLSKLVDIDLDIMLLDVEDFEQREMEQLGKFRELRPDVQLIVFTACNNCEKIMSIIKIGIQGFKLKSAQPEEIIHCVHTVYNGGTDLDAQVSNALMEHMLNKQTNALSSLSTREQEVLDLLARGKSNNDIADKLSITPRTVKYHVSSIFTKLNVKNRTEAAAKWVH